MYEDLKQWFEEGILQVRCLKDIYDEGMLVCREGNLYDVEDVVDIQGNIALSIDSEITGAVWCVFMDDDDFEPYVNCEKYVSL